jgi:hypothetical protein
MRSGLALLCVAGCSNAGSLELTLELPEDPVLRPEGMTSITLIATGPELAVANRSAYDGRDFSAGELPYANDVALSVQLHDDANQLVGAGNAGAAIDLTADGATVAIPMRRPFVYGASGAVLYAFDPTVDPQDPLSQRVVTGVANPTRVIAIDAKRVVAADAITLTILDTATHRTTGQIILATVTAISGLARVPGQSMLVVAHDRGISFVDIDSGNVIDALVGPIDQVTVGLSPAGRAVAYGLASRVAPPETPFVPCSGTSTLIAVGVGETAGTRATLDATSAIAAAPAQPGLYAAQPCKQQVARFAGDPLIEGTILTPTSVAPLPNAALVAVAGDRVWAIGTKPSRAICRSATATTTCTAQTTYQCPESSTTPRLAFVDEGARIVILSVSLAFDAPVSVEAPARIQTFNETEDMAHAHAQVLAPLATIPVDFSVLPDGEHVSVVSRSSFYIESLSDGIQFILPCLSSTVDDWSLLDVASGAVAQRIRTKCQLVFRTGAFFASWECADPPPGESPTPDEYTLVDTSALLGAE